MKPRGKPGGGNQGETETQGEVQKRAALDPFRRPCVGPDARGRVEFLFWSVRCVRCPARFPILHQA